MAETSYQRTSESGALRSSIPGTVWGYYRIRVYSKLYGYVSGNNLILQPEYFSRYYCTYSIVTIDSLGTSMYMDYGVVNSGSSTLSNLTLSAGQESGNMYSALGGFFTVTSKSTNVSSNCKLRNDGDAEASPNGRYCDRFNNTTPTYTLSNPNYNVSIKERGPTYVIINIDKTYDEYGLWRFKIFNVTTGSYAVGNKVNASQVEISNLTPNTSYTFRIEPWWAGQEISSGNNINIQVQTLYNPPSNVTINSPTDITHNSFNVRCSYNLNGSSLKTLTWEISGIFNDNKSHTLSFNSTNNPQNFSNINGYYLKSNTQYSVRVKVTNTQGYSSDWSSYTTATTLYDPPIINSISISDLTYQSALITVNYIVYAKLSNIKIEYKLKSDNQFTTLQNSTLNYYNLSGLTPNTTYEVKATLSDSQGRYVTSTTEFTTLNDPPVIYDISISDISYYSAKVSVNYKIVTEMLSFTYKVLLLDNTEYSSGTASKTFSLSDLLPNTDYKLEITLTDVYNYSSVKSKIFTTKDDRAIKLVRPNIGLSKHHAYLINSKGKTLILPSNLKRIFKK